MDVSATSSVKVVSISASDKPIITRYVLKHARVHLCTCTYGGRPPARTHTYARTHVGIVVFLSVLLMLSATEIIVYKYN